MRILKTDRLLDRVATQSRKALTSGALQPIETTTEVVADAGVEFVVRQVSSLHRKAQAAGQTQNRHDPFAPPYEPDLLVGDISDTHVALLNKFNVLEHHLLIVTRGYRDQEHLLDRDDFAALLACLAGIDGLGFYNGGRKAGASQPHKHLQLVPLPLAPYGPAVPLEPLLARASLQATIGSVRELPFVHAAIATRADWWRSPAHGAEEALGAYRTLLEAVGLPPRGEYQSAPYNLLMTRRLMWLTPRVRDAVDGVPVNALGFAGALLARDGRDMEDRKSVV